jgi:type IV pilus assembly protein PilX
MRKHHLHRQRGAALVIGLILLVVITLLAVVGMNISNTELSGATSDQVRLRAFNAAETGLETRLQTLRSDAKTDSTPETRPIADVEGSPKSVADGKATDKYITTTTYRGEGTMISRYSAGAFAGFHFTVESTGTSARNSQAVHTAGAYIVNGVGDSTSYGPTGTPPVVALP